MNTQRTLSAALLVIAAISIALLWSSPEPPEPLSGPEATETQARTPTAPRRTTDDTENAGSDSPRANGGATQGTGREAPVVDQGEEDASAAARYLQRIDDNIDHLEAAAAAARAEGNVKRAELMEKRIAGLQRRLREFEG